MLHMLHLVWPGVNAIRTPVQCTELTLIITLQVAMATKESPDAAEREPLALSASRVASLTQSNLAKHERGRKPKWPKG